MGPCVSGLRPGGEGRDPLAQRRRGGVGFCAGHVRASTFPIEPPPLRARPDDILPLARRFVAAFAASLGQPPANLDVDAEAALLAYGWPGNARQLRNALERAVLLSRGGPVTADLLPAGVRGGAQAQEARVTEAKQRAGPSPVEGPGEGRPRGDPDEAQDESGMRVLLAPATGSLDERLAHVERQLIGQALAEHNGVVRQAAQALGMNRITFARRARRHGLAR